MTTNVKNLTYLERVAIRLKGGDDARRLKFYTKLGKHLKDQKTLCYEDRDNGINKLDERIEEANEVLIEMAETIDDDRIKTGDAIDEYIIRFELKINDQIKKIEKLQAEKEVQLKQVERIEKIEAAIK